MDRPLPSPLRRARLGGPAPSRGFTLIELMIVVAIVAVLAMVAYPTYLGQVQKSRRADAISRISQVQQEQERWRANNTTYGTLANIGVAATTTDGYYTISVASNTATGYEARAQASGSQVKDTNCVHMRATLNGGTITLSSGPTNAYANSASQNNRCWNR